MLELKCIQKIYPAGNDQVVALKGIDLQFRKNEFVSILGPSGCGKTTMLNIIGGLDHYTAGDLIINGKSTKDFKDRDWDSYRNHSIGFVFQSYNLIPHQSVLQNVELALTLSGVSKKERRERAKKALEQVGLGDQLKKKPGEMSGGQMQRVAIARALVNNPDIILADEPTGALDTETSLQVMDLLKEVAQERLVIMVTHNPELAERYSTRIIRMLDGCILGDTAPVTAEEASAATQADVQAMMDQKKIKKPSMSLMTAFGLSLKNLFTKKGRTVLTSFAGSIGIIGIALIFAVSNGMKTYIDTVQEDTLSSYPITLESNHTDFASLMQALAGAAQSKQEHQLDGVYQKSIITDLINALSAADTKENDLASFKQFLTQQMKENEKAQAAISGIQYTYQLDFSVYTKNEEGKIIESDSQKLMAEMMTKYMGATMGNLVGGETSGDSSESMMSSMSMMGSASGMWQEMLSGNDGAPINDTLYSQYDLVYGSWPNAYDEIVLVVDQNHELDDLTLYALGLKTQADIDAIMDAAINKTELKQELVHWSYADICAREYKVILEADCYPVHPVTGLIDIDGDFRKNDISLEGLYMKAIPLKVTGIIKPNEDAASHMLSGSIGYTHLLTEYVIERTNASAAVQAQLANPDIDAFTGLPFRENNRVLSEQEKATDFMAYVNSLSVADQAALYIQIQSVPSSEELSNRVAQKMGNATIEEMQAMILTGMSAETGRDPEELEAYLSDLFEDDQRVVEMCTTIVTGMCQMEYAMEQQYKFAAVDPQVLADTLLADLEKASEAQKAEYYESFRAFSESDYESNLIRLGCADLETPYTINLYASSFENKDVIEEIIAAYNQNKNETERISYTDYVGIMMASITTIIDAITYVLIAFVAISLIVSSIMIGVITLISVQERTKEIGILRAIGASKRDVSSMFNAETVMIGFSAGLLGVLVTYVFCVIINVILQALTGIPNLQAILPVHYAGILILISVILTLISGIIPSRSAAKKDPVTALRTE